MERIELRIQPAAFGFHGHLFIIYTNITGEEFIVRGGPGSGYDSASRSEDLWHPPSGIGPWDDIDVETGPYTPASRDWKAPEDRSEDDSILLEEGPDLEAKFLKMAFFAQLVEQSQIDYDTVTAAWNNDSDLIVNSNTLVAAALGSAGIHITRKDLPVTAKRLPPAGFENTSAFQKHLNAFFSKNYGFEAAQGDQTFRSIYDRLETVYLDRYQGKLSEMSNFTNGHGTPEYPKIILEGIDWKATENQIREKFGEDPTLAASILAELATARTLKGDWETGFLQKFGDYAVFENSPASGSVTRGSITNVPAAAEPDHPVNEGVSQPTDMNLEERASIIPSHAAESGQLINPVPLDPAQAEPHVLTDPYARKTSYDRDRKLGRTPEEEEEALVEFEDLLREAYVVTGDMFMARGMASAQLKVEWGSSAFAAEEGTVMKYPVEKAYADPEEDGHRYVRTDVETLLTSAGIKARRWYLEPNGKTAEDRFRGSMDVDGYGPRMTLSYDDEAGARHVVTEGFQAYVAGARERRRAVEDRKLQELAKEYGLERPEPPEVNPFQALRDGLAPERVALQKHLDEAGVLHQFEVWQPQSGPQMEGYFSEADLTLYGGAAGGGKTDLIAGLALFAHHKAAIFRQSLKSLKGLIMPSTMRLNGKASGQTR